MYARRADGGLIMWKDPIVEEVRKARVELEREANNDLDRLYQRALEVQNERTTRLVSKPLQETSVVAP